MYEVFLNDRSIILANANDPAIRNNRVERKCISDRKSLKKQVNRFLSSEEESQILTGQIDWLWIEFRKIFRLLPAAGGVIHSDRGFLFIFRRGKWDFPKGKIEKNETPEKAALREVVEETGLSGLTIDKSYPSTWHIYPSTYMNSKDKWILKETKWYSMKATGNETLSPETGEDIEEVRWVSSEKLEEILANTYSSLNRLIRGLKD